MSHSAKISLALSGAIFSSILIILLAGGFGIPLIPGPTLLKVFGIACLICIKPIFRTITNLNIYSWIIISSYLLGVFYIESGMFDRQLLEGLIISCPFVIFFLYWSQTNKSLLSRKDNHIRTKESALHMDVFLISSSIMVSMFISLIFGDDNADLRAIWPIAIFFCGIYSLFFGLFYAGISYAFLPLKHKIYTFVFSIISGCLFFMINWLPTQLYFAKLRLDSATVILSVIILIHLLVTASLYSQKKFCRSRS